MGVCLFVLKNTSVESENSVRIKNITMDDVVGLRTETRNISDTLFKEINGYIQALTPLFSPRNVLGEYMEGASNKVPKAEENFSEISKKYRKIMKEIFGRDFLLSQPVNLINHQLVLTPYAKIENVDGVRLMLVSPTRWVLGFDTKYGLSNLLRSELGEEAKPDVGEIRDYVVSNLVVAWLMDNKPNIRCLIHGLHFSVSIEYLIEQQKVPFVVISAPCEAFRPQAELVKMAASFSGSAHFEDMVDEESITKIPNYFKEKMMASLNASD